MNYWFRCTGITFMGIGFLLNAAVAWDWRPLIIGLLVIALDFRIYKSHEEDHDSD